MGFKINVDRFGFAKEPKPEKNSRDYAAELAKSLIDKEEAERMNEDAVLLGKITAEESARATAIEQLREEVVNRNNAIDSAIDQEARVRELKDNALEELIDEKVTGEVAARNEAIRDAIAKEATARDIAISYAQSVEEGIRHLEDKKLEAAIKAEESARQSEVSNLSEMIDAKADKAELEGLKALSEFELIESGTLNENVNAIVPDLKGNRYKEIYCYFKVVRSADYATNAEKGRIYIANGSAQTDLLWDQQNWLTENFNDAWELTVHIKAFGEVCSTKVWFYKYYATPYARTPVSSTFCGGEAPFKQLSKPYIDYLDVRFSSKDGTRVLPSGTTFEIWGVRA